MTARKYYPVLVCGRRITHHCYDGTGGRAGRFTRLHTYSGNVVGQTSNNPCIIGDPSCDTNTKQTFPLAYTSNSGPCKGGNCNFTSPLYQASSNGLALPNIIPTSFDVGVDENVATGQGPEILTTSSSSNAASRAKAASRLTI